MIRKAIIYFIEKFNRTQWHIDYDRYTTGELFDILMMMI